MERNMENEIETLGPFQGVCRDISPNNEADEEPSRKETGA